jgi:hypothetical protein
MIAKEPELMERKPNGERGITLRALIAGAFLAALIGGGAAYENLLISGSTMNFDYSMGAAIFCFALFALFLNPMLHRLQPAWSFKPTELATLYIMAMVACVLPTNALVGQLLPALSGGIYYATPENNWLESVIPYIKPQLLVGDSKGIKEFYEGLSAEEAIPWQIWLDPLLYWSMGLAGFFGIVIALMVLLRKQWVVNERLLYPLVQVPIAMIGDTAAEIRAYAPLFRQGIFWIGVLIPAVMYSLKSLHHYNPMFPLGLPTFVHVPFANNAVTIPFGINYAGIGFGYLLTTKLSFSIWIMALLTIIEEVVLARIGLFSSERLIYNYSPAVYPSYQGAGALLVFALAVLWTGRRHLRAVFEAAWRGEEDVDEILSYRSTCLLLLGSLIALGGWLVGAGASGWLVVVFIPVFFLMMLGLTRIVAEGGLAVSRLPILPNDFVVGALGSGTLGATNLGVLGLTFPLGSEMRTSLMAALAHGLKLAEIHVRAQRRRLFAGVALAIVLSTGCAIITMLYIGYNYGAVNLSAHWFFGTTAGGRLFDFIAYHSGQAAGPRWDSLGFAGLGAGIQLLLMLAHQRLAWWPLHPLSFPIGAIWCTHQVMASMLFAWVAKIAALHYGGVRLYNATKPFFLGLILGQYLTGGVWLVIDGFTGMQANYLFFW